MHKANQKSVQGLPLWLQQVEPTRHSYKKDRFLTRTIQHIIQVLQISRMMGTQQKRPHPLIQLFCMVLFSAMVSLSSHVAFLSIPLALVLVQLCCIPSKDLLRILKVSGAVVGIHSLVILPAILYLKETRSILLVVKLEITITELQLFARLISWRDVIDSLQLLRVPTLFLTVFQLSLKYIYVLGEVALSLLYALRLRSIGHTKHTGMTLGGIMGTVFLKSKEEMQALYQAMVCRGFDGTFPRRTSKWNISWYDGAVMVVIICMAYVFFVGGR